MELPADQTAASSISSHAVFLTGWLLPQLAVLALCASRIGLWATAPQAGELFALPMMVGVQIATGAAVFPRLNRVTNAAMALIAAWPMGLIAATLGAAPIGTAIRAEIAVDLWIFSLALSSAASSAWPGRGVAWTVALFWSIGGGLLLYLRLEFAAVAAPLPSLIAGPLVYAIRIALQEPNTGSLPPLVPTALSAVFLAISQVRRRRAPQK
jgi:hypothetical protein